MSDRAKRKRRRLFFSYLLLAGLVFALVRVFGPAIIAVRSTALSPVIQEGDIVLARRGTEQLGRGSLVITRAPLRTGSRTEDVIQRLRQRFSDTAPPRPVVHPVPRIVAGLPGDEVRWDHQSVSVGALRYDLTILHEALPQREQTVLLGEDEFFLLSLQPGRADSRIVGPVDRSSILFRIQSVILPVHRRGIVEDHRPGFAGEP